MVCREGTVVVAQAAREGLHRPTLAASAARLVAVLRAVAA